MHQCNLSDVPVTCMHGSCSEDLEHSKNKRSISNLPVDRTYLGNLLTRADLSGSTAQSIDICHRCCGSQDPDCQNDLYQHERRPISNAIRLMTSASLPSTL